jgi:ABC-type transport system substrate-binding protein
MGLPGATLSLRAERCSGDAGDSADGHLTIRIKPGTYFSDDPAFNGRKRELTAADFVYSWKRLVDPRVRSPNADLVKGKFVGLDAAAAKAKATGHFDHDADVEGLRALDKYTLQLKLVEPDYTLLSYLDSAALRAVAREVIDKYADSVGRAMDHPIGTGAYRLKAWQRGQKVVLEANPNYREEYFPAAPAGSDAATKAMAAAMKGKRLPQVGIVDVAIIEESNPRLLMFDRGELDLTNVPSDLASNVMDESGKLLPQYAKRGVDLQRATELTVTYAYFNMEDPVVGGYTPDKVALRRAICSAYNIGTKFGSSGRVKASLRHSRCRRMSKAISRASRGLPAMTLRWRARCSTSSATRIATATDFAKCRMDVLWRFNWPRNPTRRHAITTSCGSAA